MTSMNEDSLEAVKNHAESLIDAADREGMTLDEMTQACLLIIAFHSCRVSGQVGGKFTVGGTQFTVNAGPVDWQCLLYRYIKHVRDMHGNSMMGSFICCKAEPLEKDILEEMHHAILAEEP